MHPPLARVPTPMGSRSSCLRAIPSVVGCPRAPCPAFMPRGRPYPSVDVISHSSRLLSPCPIPLTPPRRGQRMCVRPGWRPSFWGLDTGTPCVCVCVCAARSRARAPGSARLDWIELWTPREMAKSGSWTRQSTGAPGALAVAGRRDSSRSTAGQHSSSLTLCTAPWPASKQETAGRV